MKPGIKYPQDVIIEGDCKFGKNVQIKGAFVTIRNVEIGDNTVIWGNVNLFGCRIGKDCMIGFGVEITKDVVIGDRCRIQSHSFVCDLVTIEDDVFIGHGVMFINDRYPPSGDSKKWEPTLIKNHVSVGSNATILPVVINEGAMIGAGSIVTKNVMARTTVMGNPAKN